DPEPLRQRAPLAEPDPAAFRVAGVEREERGEPDAKPDAECQPKRSNGERPLALAELLPEPLTYIVLKTRATTEGCKAMAAGAEPLACPSERSAARYPSCSAGATRDESVCAASASDPSGNGFRAMREEADEA